MNKIFGYEPVAIMGAVQTLLIMLVSFDKLEFLNLDSTDDVALLVAVLAAVEAVYVAYETRQTLLAPLVALFKAAVAFGILYGLSLTDEQSATAIAVITAFVALLQRDQVDATKEEAGSFQVA